MGASVDYLSTLPADITWNILPFLKANDLAILSYVSRELHDRVLHCATTGKYIEITKNFSDTKIFPQIASFVEGFTDGCGKEPAHEWLQLISKYYLKKLAIPVLMLKKINTWKPYQEIQQTLTKFIIETAYMPPLEYVLFLSCPNLTQLAYSARIYMNLDLEDSDLIPDVSHLIYPFVSDYTDMNYGKLEIVLSRCSDIRY
ncbi:hypothetical protein BDA99DRAFT_558732 [Phascolomyces articulosus]|uniref:F-box domain-containing protein n=1 Tax=Phascolomyces articulosus TaxID=60185 RepID=A0AAD5K2P3_9FUNG|nr:hypothetical protein BDA99DRAFT_558732 [Phascolomyces articulosus]